MCCLPSLQPSLRPLSRRFRRKLAGMYNWVPWSGGLAQRPSGRAKSVGCAKEAAWRISNPSHSCIMLEAPCDCGARSLSTQARALHVPLRGHCCDSYDHDTVNRYHCLGALCDCGGYSLLGASFVNTSKGHPRTAVATLRPRHFELVSLPGHRPGALCDCGGRSLWARPLSTQARAIHLPLLRHYDHDFFDWYPVHRLGALCDCGGHSLWARPLSTQARAIHVPLRGHCCDITTTTLF